MRSGYEDSFFGRRFTYGNFFTPSQDNRWSARTTLAWKPNSRDKVTYNFSKRIAIDQGFTRTFISAQGDVLDPAYPWRWTRNIQHAPTFFEDNVQTSLQWRRSDPVQTERNRSHPYPECPVTARRSHSSAEKGSAGRCC